MRAAVLACLFAGCASAPELKPLELRERWVYFPQDLREEKNVGKLFAIMKRAAKAGYNTVLLEDANFARLPLMHSVDFVGTPRIVVFGGGRMLNYDPRGPHGTQHMADQSAVFNSLECSEVRIAFGAWNGESGEAYFFDPKIEETGLVNVLRREGAPL